MVLNAFFFPSFTPDDQVDVGSNDDLDCRSAMPAQHDNLVNDNKPLVSDR